MKNVLRAFTLVLGLLFAADLHAAGSLRVTLAPSQAVSAGAQWRVDGGNWKNSGAAVNNLSNGSHQVTFKAVSGWLTPAALNVTITNGTTTTVTSTYVRPSSLRIDLTPTSGQWRIDGGAWRASGTTATGITPGAHAIEYAAVSGYATPAAESVTLIENQTTTVARSYTQLAQVTVTLTPSAAQWRIDGGAWRASGTTAPNLALGAHTIDYAALAGYTAPSSESVTLASGQTLSFTRSYIQLAQVTVTLTPASAQWRINGGAWIASGVTAANLAPGSHAIDYAPLSGYTAPASESVTLAAGQSLPLSRAYVQLAQVSVTLSPSNAQWQLDGGAWQSSGVTLANVSPGSHTLNYSAVAGYITPTAESISLIPGETLSLTRGYTALASLNITLAPSSARWRLDGGPWQDTSTTLNNLSLGTHTVEYSDLSGYITPASESVSLVSGANTLSRSYTQLASLSVSLTPSTAQWRLDGGAWQASGATVSNISLGAHTVDYSTVSGYTTPSSAGVQLQSGANSLSTTYSPAPWQFKLTLVPGSAQFRVNGGGWNPSGATTMGLTPGDYLVDFSNVQGYATPAPITLTMNNGDSRDLTITYELAPAATLSVNLSPANAQWRVDQGTWNASGATVIGLAPGLHFVEYTPRSGYITPSAENIDLAANENRVLTRSYLTAPGYSTIRTFTDAGINPAFVRGSDGVLYVTTASGGGNDRGQVFRINASGSGYTVLKSFTDGTNAPYAPNSLIEGSDGKLYGTTQYGGLTANKGTVFKLNKDGSSFAIVHYFDGPYDGSVPNALTEASDGLLYGTTQNSGGGTNVFRVAKDGSAFTRIGSTAGGRGVVEGPDGFLYSATASNTYGTFGSVTKMRKDGTGFAVLKNFDNSADGSAPRSAPLVGSDGVLYGTPSAGGSANKGVVYRLNPDGTGFSVLRSFLGDTTDGGRLDAPLNEGPDGALYGATYSAGSYGRGTVFRLNKNGTGYTTLRHLAANGTEGGGNSLPVLVAPDGTLYSANRFFAGDSAGLLFKLSNDGSSFTALRSFGAPEGAMPRWVMEASNGALYGVTYEGGGAGYGAVFKVNKDSSGFSVLHGFAAANDGSYPQGQILEASDGMLYGTTLGGNPSNGVIFKIAKDGTGYTIVHGFGGTNDGWGLASGVIEGSDGALYGSTIAGGAAGGYGALFRINKDGSGHTLLRSFANGSSDGNSPVAAPLEGPNGLLYATNYGGGTANLGTLFSIARDGTGFTVLHQFAGNATDGSAPYAKLFLASDGLLYGTTSAGGVGGKGTIYTVNLDGTGYTVLKHFSGGANDGATPSYSGVLEKNGVLYGLTTGGGSFDAGTLYRLNKDGTGFMILLNFGVDSSDGRLPADGLIKASDGAFYGTAPYGDRGGTLFRFGIN